MQAIKNGSSPFGIQINVDILAGNNNIICVCETHVLKKTERREFFSFINNEIILRHF